MLYWINRQLWPFGLQLFISVPQSDQGPLIDQAQLHILRNDPFEPVVYMGTHEEDRMMLERALAWIAARVTPVSAEPAEDAAEGSPPSPSGSPAGPVH